MALFRGYANVNLQKNQYAQMKQENLEYEDFHLLDRITENETITYSLNYYDNKKGYNSKLKTINNITAKSIYMALIIEHSTRKELLEIGLVKKNIPKLDKDGKQKFIYETISVTPVDYGKELLNKIRIFKKE